MSDVFMFFFLGVALGLAATVCAALIIQGPIWKRLAKGVGWGFIVFFAVVMVARIVFHSPP